MPEAGSTERTQRRPNYVYAIMSVAAVLFLLGFFGVLLLQANRLSSALKEKIDLIVELREDTPTEAREKVEAGLRKSPFVKEGSVRFISKEAAIEEMSKEFGEDLLRLDLPNPLYDVVTFNVTADYLATDSLANIRARLRQWSAVSDVYYQESLVDQVATNARRIGWVALAIGLFFVLMAALLIHNTVRLALYANRFLIKTQELVGATWSFISRPYLQRSLRHGLLSGVLAIGGLLLTLWWLERQVPELDVLRSPGSLLFLFIGLVLLGVLINWISTYYVVRKYLRMRVDDLY